MPAPAVDARNRANSEIEWVTIPKLAERIGMWPEAGRHGRRL